MNVVRAELSRAWLLAIRMPLHFILGCLFLAAMFFAFQAGYRVIGAGNGALASYIVWLLAANGLTYASGEMEKDIQHGVVQHIYLSGLSLLRISAIRSAIGMAHSVLVVLVVTVPILLLGGTLHLGTGWGAVFALVDAIVIGVALGFAATGLALLFRPLAFVLLPFQLALMVSAAVGALPAGPALAGIVLLPLTPASLLLASHTPSWELVLLALVHAAIYLLAAIAFLNACEAAARRRGRLVT